MPEASVDASTLIDWGVASSALSGQTQSGDLHLVKPVSTGVLIAVVDGLGHGADAATAARTAVATLDQHATESVSALLERCHWALKGSRGVVMSLAFADRAQHTLTWIERIFPLQMRNNFAAQGTQIRRRSTGAERQRLVRSGVTSPFGSQTVAWLSISKAQTSSFTMLRSITLAWPRGVITVSPIWGSRFFVST